ncbi:leucine-rich repeat-containing protein 47 [Orussus abietinus]|uniref:leucine-rich repeat-containing protein 47 n=1 Tax=Orussus abietinus TaxID=222816 RepID=UPI0006257CA4|nr:leucine-rich repeat-containing protein 47 [Orussus abietinus]XP_012273720.1 leucine-rich repeat-containing protein 47 [Orussus abietinus]
MTTMDSAWPEVNQVVKDKRHELILSGEDISQKITNSGLDKCIFGLQGLNYLNIHQTCLKEIPDEIGNLTNLTTLVLHSNKITKIPSAIKNLTKLKLLDCSRNMLENVPEELGDLPQLTTINFGSNLLTELPSQIHNIKLTSLDLSNNNFDTFPDVCYAELSNLAEIKINGNQIKQIPNTINILPSLKMLDLADNMITEVPGELADCKLKEVNLKGNILSDKRLFKLVDQCRTKQVLDYVRQNCPRASETPSHVIDKSKKSKKGRKSSESKTVIPPIEKCTHTLRITKVSEITPSIKITPEVKDVRPHILGCIIKNLKFTEDSFRKFIQLQTKLHEGICDKRNAATLATHDFNLIVPGDITYTAKLPNEIEIKPLMRNKSYTGAELFQQLQAEADKLRREKKRNVYSGIHRYLYLLEGKRKYPCVLDSSDQTISLPPITNSDITKASPSTSTIFIEVTSASSQQVCRNVLDLFLKELVTLGLGCAAEADKGDYYELLIEQVKVVDMDGNMKHVYPSRADLLFNGDDISVLRD